MNELRALRRAAGLGQREFAALLSVAPETFRTWESGRRALIEDFVQAIREGRPPRCDGREGRRSVAVVEAIYASSRSARAVTVTS